MTIDLMPQACTLMIKWVGQYTIVMGGSKGSGITTFSKMVYINLYLWWFIIDCG